MEKNKPHVPPLSIQTGQDEIRQLEVELRWCFRFEAKWTERAKQWLVDKGSQDIEGDLAALRAYATMVYKQKLKDKFQPSKYPKPVLSSEDVHLRTFDQVQLSGQAQKKIKREDPTPIPLSSHDTNYKPQGAIEVDTYQIAVPNGDCSVHLLVDRGARTSAPSRGTILRSILMDGGNDGSLSADNAALIIKQSLVDIWSQYEEEEIQFHAWVITHWDYDHWGGSFKLFRDTCNKFGHSSFMRYSKTGEPLTLLYCPNWNWVPEFIDKPGIIPNPLLLKTRPHSLRIASEHNKLEAVGKGLVHFWDFAEQGNAGFNLCFAVFGHWRLLGRDLFTGETCWDIPSADLRQDTSFDRAQNAVFRKFHTLQSWMQYTTSSGDLYPRFFCIGAGGFLLGGIVNEEQLRAALARSKASKEDTWANLSSIMSVLHFPNAGHISLYWGGDSVTWTESRLATSKFFQFPDGKSDYSCTVAKWSHHGGQHSSPMELWKTLKPQKCVVSANRTGRYLHPHPRTIIRFYQYCKERALLVDRKPAQLYSTFYPGWILNPTEGASKKLAEFKNNGDDKSLRHVWRELSPVQKTGIKCPTMVRAAENEAFTESKVYKPPRRRGRPPTKRTLYQIKYLHILSSKDQNRDGIITPYAMPYYLKEGTTLEPIKQVDDIEEDQEEGEVPGSDDVEDTVADAVYDVPVVAEEERKKWEEDFDEVQVEIPISSPEESDYETILSSKVQHVSLNGPFDFNKGGFS